MNIDWYTFNVFTLGVDIIVTFFSFAALVIVIEEKRALRRLRGKNENARMR